jgi:diguanylate cyclase (GGDEF)-like protein
LQERYQAMRLDLRRTAGYFRPTLLRLDDCHAVDGAAISALAILAAELFDRDIARFIEERARSIKQRSNDIDWSAGVGACRHVILTHQALFYEFSGDTIKAFQFAVRARESAVTVPDEVFGWALNSAIARNAGEANSAIVFADRARQALDALDPRKLSPQERLAMLSVAEACAPFDPAKAGELFAGYCELTPIDTILSSSVDPCTIAYETFVAGVIAEVRGERGQARFSYREAFSMFKDLGYVRRAVISASASLHLRVADDEDLRSYISLRLAGTQNYVSKSFTRADDLIASLERHPIVAKLPRTQKELVVLLCTGKTNKEIAELREVRVQTIKNVLTKSVFPAFGVSSRAALVSVCLSEYRRLPQLHERLAPTDGLTGLANRQRFDEEVLEAEWQRAGLMGASLTLIMLDIDHLNAYNDTYGRPVVNRCLERVGRALCDELTQPAQVIARYGGQKFAGVLPSTDRTAAAVLAESWRDCVASMEMRLAGSPLGRLTASLGVATAVPADGAAFEQLVMAADAALREAKQWGGNCVCVHDDVAASWSRPARLQQPVARNNLPPQTTALIGRCLEVQASLALLRAHALITITGGGGVGKSRVAVSVAAEALATFADGVCYIDLARLTDPMAIVPTIGTILGAEIPGDAHAADTLFESLQSKHVLVVFDNCDYVLQPVAELCAKVLQTCGGVRILATSREPLDVAGETLYRLAPFAVPPADAPLTATGALEYDAVALFVARATAANRRFAITDRNAATIAEICRRLDGIALGIEFAAARAGTLDLYELAQRLDERCGLLLGGDRPASPRHQTLHALIGWSYDLLAEQERMVFQRLSIFAGSWSLAAASDICAGDGITRDDLQECVEALVRKSLVVKEATAADCRFRLLGSIRAFGREKLAGTGAAHALARRHASYFLAIAQRAERTLRTSRSQDWLQGHERHLDDYRAVFEWSLVARADPAIGAWLACALQYLFLAQSVSEGKGWLDKAFEQIVPGSAPALEAALWLAMASLMRNQAPVLVRGAAERAIALFRRVGNLRGLTEALRLHAQIVGWYFPEQRADGRVHAEEALAIARNIDDPISIALALRACAVTTDVEAFEEWRALLEESLMLSRAYGNDQQVSTALTTLAELEFRAGRTSHALTYGRDAIQSGEASGYDDLLAFAHVNHALYAGTAGDVATARRSALTSLQISVERHFAEYLSWSVQALAAVSVADGDFTRAARFVGFCSARARTEHAPRRAFSSLDISHRLLAQTIRTFMGETAFARETAIGAALDKSAVVDAAFAKQAS